MGLSVRAQVIDNTLDTTTVKAKKRNEFSAFVFAQHYMGFGDQRNEPSTFFWAQLNYRLPAQWTAFVIQTGQKVYFINDSNEPEVIVNDSFLGLQKNFRDIFGGNAQVRFRATVPISEFSRRNGLISRPDIRLRNAWSISDKLSLILGLEVAPYFNRFTTRATSSTDAGEGSPMPLLRTVLQSIVNYNLAPKLSLSSYFFYVDRQFERLGPSNNISDGNTSNHDFWYGLSANYQATKKLTTTLAFDHANTIEANGSTEFYIFDPVASQWSLGLTYVF